MRGPAPKTATRKKIAGSRRPAHEDPNPEPTAGLPACPKFLTGLAAAKWKELAADVTWVTTVDLDLVAVYCSVWARWREAEIKIAKEGTVLVSDNGGTYQNPQLAVSNRATQQLAKLGALLGLNPTDRPRIKVPRKKDKDPFESFLAG